ncbi:hypothetical protein [Pseudarthrobacter chlorophenolicus]|uniref:hypothetical protein n=1 Tax=Pseudarthrobacter chlorophenolicus TaxID=85085 RepID=UPI00069869DF|nr:hypothetical protein [Pseudarthrobacter chlorophenolicus]
MPSGLPVSRRVAALLRRSTLLAAVLAVVAGIFGMHVMTAGHTSHAAHAGAAPDPGAAQSAVDAGMPAADRHPAGHHAHLAGNAGVAPSPDAVRSADQRSVPGDLVARPYVAEPAACTPSHPGGQDAAASCTPLAKTGSLSAEPPTAMHSHSAGRPASAGTVTGYSHIAPSPSPCELSISRT